MSSHGSHADANDPFQRRTAIFMALYTVLIAFNGMLTNQARTKALLLSNEATNQWAYYQAKSTKQVIALATKTLLERLPEKPAEEVEGHQRLSLASAVEKITQDAERYEDEKEGIKKKAEEVAEQGEHQQHREHWFEYATTIAELAIVLASVALLLKSKLAFRASAVLAIASLALTARTLLL